MSKPVHKRTKPPYGDIAGLYDLGKTIGKGHFAVVKRAKHVFTGLTVAVKVIDKSKLDQVSKEHLFQEVNCMKLVQHPNVVRLYEVIDTQTKLYLILELGDGGDMYDYIMKHEKGLDESKARTYFKQIVQAIHYCHKLHVVHRDLKPENVVFFEKSGIVKLTDFGFSNKFVPGRHLETSCGSLAYSAPEILLGDSYNAPAVDVWSLGVILYMLVVGEAPFQEANDSETLTMILDCKYHVPSHVSNSCKELIRQMLKREPEERASLDQIMNHAWLKEDGFSPVPMVPRISREHLSDEDHSHILQLMLNGKIASKEDILSSIEQNAYNHITATYYLLAERRLMRRRDQHHLHHHNHHHSGARKDDKPGLSPLALSPRVKSASAAETRERNQNIESLLSPPGVRVPAVSVEASSPDDSLKPVMRSHSPVSRRCSLIREESGEESDSTHEQPGTSSQKLLLPPHATAEESLSDDSDARSHSSVEYGEPVTHLPPKPRSRGSNVRPLHTVRSSPQLLNQIFEEEGETEEEDEMPTAKKMMSPHQRNITQLTSLASPEVMKKFERQQRKRLTRGQRGTSYSSSDTSDTDETDPTRRRKDKMKQRFPRRDSSDHSSDTDGPGGPSGLGGSGTRSFGSNARGSVHNSNDSSDKGSSSRKHRDNGRSAGGKQHNASTVKDSSGSESTLSGLSPLKSRISANLSNLSLTSLNSQSSKYVLPQREAFSLSPEKSLGESGVEVLNEENKARSKIIHVRSKDFTDLMDRFTGSPDDFPRKEMGVRFRRRTKDKMKVDINRNGLIARATDCSLSEDEAREKEQQQQNVAKTKCCSVI